MAADHVAQTPGWINPVNDSRITVSTIPLALVQSVQPLVEPLLSLHINNNARGDWSQFTTCIVCPTLRSKITKGYLLFRVDWGHGHQS